MACLRGLGVGQVCEILKKQNKQQTRVLLLPGGQRGQDTFLLPFRSVWGLVKGRQLFQSHRLLKQHCSVKEGSVSWGGAPRPQQLPSLLLPAYFLPLLVRLCLFLFLPPTSHPSGSTKEGNRFVGLLLCTVNCQSTYMC